MSDTTLSSAQAIADVEALVADAGPRHSGYLIKIDDELELVTLRGDGLDWQVERGVLGTEAADHTESSAVVVEPLFGTLVAAGAVADLADPATATAEDCANAVNDLLASLRAAGLLAA